MLTMKIAATSNSRYYVDFDSYDYTDILLLDESNLRSINLFFTDARAIDIEAMRVLRAKVIAARKRNICIKLVIFTLNRIDNKFIREKVFENIPRGYQIQGGYWHVRKLGDSRKMSIVFRNEGGPTHEIIVTVEPYDSYGFTRRHFSISEVVSYYRYRKLKYGSVCYEDLK